MIRKGLRTCGSQFSRITGLRFVVKQNVVLHAKGLSNSDVIKELTLLIRDAQVHQGGIGGIKQIHHHGLAKFKLLVWDNMQIGTCLFTGTLNVLKGKLSVVRMRRLRFDGLKG